MVPSSHIFSLLVTPVKYRHVPQPAPSFCNRLIVFSIYLTLRSSLTRALPSFLPESAMDAHDEQLMNCVRVNFAKDEIVTPARLQRKCPIPFYTADNHLEHIVGVDLGDGTKISRRSYKSLYKDPHDEDKETTKRLSDEDFCEP